MPTPSVAVVAYPNVSPFHLSVPCILFGDILPGEQLFSLTVCAAEDGPIPAAHGMSVAPGAGLEALASADIVIARGKVMTRSSRTRVKTWLAGVGANEPIEFLIAPPSCGHDAATDMPTNCQTALR